MLSLSKVHQFEFSGKLFPTAPFSLLPDKFVLVVEALRRNSGFFEGIDECISRPPKRILIVNLSEPG